MKYLLASMIVVSFIFLMWAGNHVRSIMELSASIGAQAPQQSSGQLPRSSDCRYIESVPLIITEPGTFCLTGSVENTGGNQDSITILADNVRILGNGNCIIGPKGASTTIDGVRAIDRFNIGLYDLCIIGHKTGVIIGDTVDSYNKFFDDYGVDQFRLSRFISLKELKLTQQTFQGIHLRGENLEILNSSVEHVGGTDTIKHAFATGLYVSGTSCNISDNRVFGLRPSGNGEGVGIAVYSGAACRIANNLVDPFKPTEYGRSYGIWSRPRTGAVPVFTENIVVNADYAFGPFGYFAENTSINTSCNTYVDRQFSMSEKQVGSSIMRVNNTVTKDQLARPCKDNIEQVVARAKDNLTPNAAFAVVMAYGEQDPAKYASEQLAWIMVSSELGHSTANKIVNSSDTAGRPKGVYAEARNRLSDLKSELQLAPSLGMTD